MGAPPGVAPAAASRKTTPAPALAAAVVPGPSPPESLPRSAALSCPSSLCGTSSVRVAAQLERACGGSASVCEVGLGVGWSGGWVGKGVIKWANTKFMAKMATKSKEVVEAHTQKKNPPLRRLTPAWADDL